MLLYPRSPSYVPKTSVKFQCVLISMSVTNTRLCIPCVRLQYIFYKLTLPYWFLWGVQTSSSRLTWFPVFSFVVLHGGILNHLQEHDWRSCFLYFAISSGVEEPININNRHIIIIQGQRGNTTLSNKQICHFQIICASA
jgi:hypothetical protein